MENRVRDLEQIQERDGEDRARRIGSLLMAALALVGLTFAIGVVVGRAAEPDTQQEAVDPLAKLERTAGAAKTAGALDKPTAKSAAVEPSDLSFPHALTETEDRPEVLAALRAAAAEEAVLAEGPAHADLGAAAEAALVDEGVSAEQLVASVPAAVAAGSAGRSLPRSLKHDPMVAAAIRSDAPEGLAASHGHDGEFTLQVISYDSPEPARSFAAGLREKGHEAFVTTADIADRGKYFRVRIGPFKSRQQAETYRRKFEEDEHMNTFVVRRKDDEA